MEIRRHRSDAERRASNAIVELGESIITLRQNLPTRNPARATWRRTIRHLERAKALAESAHTGMLGTDFDVLRERD